MTRLSPVVETRVQNPWRRTVLLLSSVLLIMAMMAALARGSRADGQILQVGQ